MKRNRTQALGFILDHRKKVLKGLTALLQILEKLPAGMSVAELVAAGKAASRKAKPKKSKGKAKKTNSKSSAKPDAMAAAAKEPAPAPAGQPQPDDALM
jgi:hypothetical protein